MRSWCVNRTRRTRYYCNYYNSYSQIRWTWPLASPKDPTGSEKIQMARKNY